jgi:nicotinamidase-related amidase
VNALLIVDMQEDFVRPGAPMCVAGAQATLPEAARLLAFARARGWPVVHAVRAHEADGSDVERFRAARFARTGGWAVPGTDGARVVAELAPLPGEHAVPKPRFSAFMHTRLDLLLRRLGVRHLVICGTQYPNCIRTTAFDAVALDYDVTVVTSATSAASEDVAAANVRDMRAVGIACVTREELEAGAGAGGPAPAPALAGAR